MNLRRKAVFSALAGSVLLSALSGCSVDSSPKGDVPSPSASGSASAVTADGEGKVAKGVITLASVREVQERLCAPESTGEVQMGNQCYILADGAIEVRSVDKIEEEAVKDQKPAVVVTLPAAERKKYINLVNSHLNQPLAIILNGVVTASYTPTTKIPDDLVAKVPLGPLRENDKKSVDLMGG